MADDERWLEVEAWLTRARQDLRAARVGQDARPPLMADAAFHCHQAVEKSLKACLVQREAAIPRTHDIGLLALACITYEPYPSEPFEPEAVEVESALEIAATITERIASLVTPR